MVFRFRASRGTPSTAVWREASANEGRRGRAAWLIPLLAHRALRKVLAGRAQLGISQAIHAGVNYLTWLESPYPSLPSEALIEKESSGDRSLADLSPFYIPVPIDS